jgi:lysozyme
MKPSQDCINNIKIFERLSLKAYPDTGGVWTIGFGIIVYPDGREVKEGDVVTREYAEKLLVWQIGMKTNEVNKFLPGIFNQNQYDALFDFAYNCGVPALHGSTLLRVITKNPNDQTQLTVQFLDDKDPIKRILVAKKIERINIIRYNFVRWSFDNSKYIEGLYKRRCADADLYIKPAA